MDFGVSLVKYLAEREGFEPSRPFWGLRDFESRAFDHSAISPQLAEAYCTVHIPHHTINSLPDQPFRALRGGASHAYDLCALIFITPFSMSFVVASKVKELVNGKKMMAAGDLSEHLSKHLEQWLARGTKAAAANDRKTVRGGDILSFQTGKKGLVVASRIKEYVNGKNMMAAGDLPEYVDALAEWLLMSAADRASANDRKTVRGTDL